MDSSEHCSQQHLQHQHHTHHHHHHHPAEQQLEHRQEQQQQQQQQQHHQQHQLRLNQKRLLQPQQSGPSSPEESVDLCQLDARQPASLESIPAVSLADLNGTSGGADYTSSCAIVGASAANLTAPMLSKPASSEIPDSEPGTHLSDGGSHSDLERRYKPQKFCAVCGDKAIACNFNAVTCESCKAFFRRNAFKEQKLKCLFDNRCFINRNTRRFCSKCRLLKCFQIGMRREWILTDEQKQIKRVKIMQNKQSKQRQQQQQQHQQQHEKQSTTNQDDNDEGNFQDDLQQHFRQIDVVEQIDSIKSENQKSINNSGDDISNQPNSRPLSRARSDYEDLDQQQEQDQEQRQQFQDVPLQNKRRRVQTRDVAVSCPDQLELPDERQVNYCSMAYHCQYCSFRMAGYSPSSASSYYRNQQQQQQQQSPAPPILPSPSTGISQQVTTSFGVHHQNSANPMSSQTSQQLHHLHDISDQTQVLTNNLHHGQHVLHQHHHHHSPQQPFQHQRTQLSQIEHSRGQLTQELQTNNLHHNQLPQSQQVRFPAPRNALYASAHQGVVQFASLSPAGYPEGQVSNSAAGLSYHQLAGVPNNQCHAHEDPKLHSHQFYGPEARNSFRLPRPGFRSSTVPRFNSSFVVGDQMPNHHNNITSSYLSVHHSQQQQQQQQLSAAPTIGLTDTTQTVDRERAVADQATPTRTLTTAPSATTNTDSNVSESQSPVSEQPISRPTSPPAPMRDVQSANSNLNSLKSPRETNNIKGDIKPVDEGLCQSTDMVVLTNSNSNSSDSSLPISRNNTPTSGETNSYDSSSPFPDQNKTLVAPSKANSIVPTQVVIATRLTDCQSDGIDSPLSSATPSLSSSSSSPANNKIGNLVQWKDIDYLEPANTELDMRARLERIPFSDSEKVLITEMIEATRFLFEHSQQSIYNSVCSLVDIVQFCDAALRSFIKTVKLIKAFRMLVMDDQISLLKTACFRILLLRSSFHYDIEVEGWRDSRTGRVMQMEMLKKATKSLVFERHRDLVNKIPQPLRKDRLTIAILSLILLFDPNVNLKHSNSVNLDNLIYLSLLRKYLHNTQPDPLSKYETLVSAIDTVKACADEYNNFFSKDFQPEQMTPLLIEIFDISINNSM